MATPLSGELSRRRLGTRSGDLRRIARQSGETGGRRRGSDLNLAAAQAKLDEGSAITSAESNRAERAATMRAESGLMESRRRAVLGRETSTPETQRESRMAFYERQRVARGGAPAAAPADTTAPRPEPASQGVPILGGVMDAARSVFPKREGLIDGRPASEAIAGAEATARAGGPRSEGGADVARRNLGENPTNDSFRSAVADLRSREAADAGRAQRGRDYSATADEPGNLAQLRERDRRSTEKNPPAVGPAQSALNEAMDRKRARKTEEFVGTPMKEIDAPEITKADIEPAGSYDFTPTPVNKRDRMLGDFSSRFTPEERQKAREDGARPDPTPSLVQRTNAAADKLRERANPMVDRTNTAADTVRARGATPYSERMREGVVSIDELPTVIGKEVKDVRLAIDGAIKGTKIGRPSSDPQDVVDAAVSVGKGAKNIAVSAGKGVVNLPERARRFSDRTNRWAENFRNRAKDPSR